MGSFLTVAAMHEACLMAFLKYGEPLLLMMALPLFSPEFLSFGSIPARATNFSAQFLSSLNLSKLPISEMMVAAVVFPTPGILVKLWLYVFSLFVISSSSFATWL